MLSRPAHLEEDTRRITLMTNDDSRCVSSTTVIARVAHDLLYNGEVTPIEKLVEICQDIDPRTIPHLMAAYEGELEDLEIEEWRIILARHPIRKNELKIFSRVRFIFVWCG